MLRWRSLPAIAAALALAAGLLLMPAPAAGAAGDPQPPAAQAAPEAPGTTLPLDEEPPPIPRIIPLPNSGHKPADPGDPGGFLQVSLFFFICGGLVVLAGLVALESRRKKRRAAGRSALGGPRTAQHAR